MVETMGVRAKDRFQIITEHAADMLIYDPEYLNIQRSDAIVMLQISLSAGRSADQ